MKQNFFEVLGAANIERIHSQMISWIFNADALSVKNKSNILCNFFNIKKDFKDIFAITEYRNIDVLIIADSDAFIIENKVKISEHDNQLTKYESIDITKDFPQVKNRHFLYLTLIPEDIGTDNWLCKTYESLLNVLKEFRIANPNEFNQYAFNEYLDSVNQLVKSFKDFDNDHRIFSNVFQEGSSKKHEKALRLINKKYPTEQEYVAMNQLETIFQKYFLYKISNSIGLKRNEYSIDESHGTAILQIKIKRIQINNRELNIGIQFQGNTVKINLAPDDYKTSSSSDLSKDAKDLFEKIRKENDFARINNPRSKNYLSISKKLGDNIWSSDFNTIRNIYQNEYTKLKNVIEMITVHNINVII